jgi:hypothetical protein
MKRKHKRLRFAGDADALHFQSAGHMMAGTYIEISFQTADTDAPWRDIRSVCRFLGLRLIEWQSSATRFNSED